MRKADLVIMLRSQPRGDSHLRSSVIGVSVIGTQPHGRSFLATRYSSYGEALDQEDRSPPSHHAKIARHSAVLWDLAELAVGCGHLLVYPGGSRAGQLL
jgi:hypothetical protein